MKYYKLLAAINPLEKNCFYNVYNTMQYAHCPETGLDMVKQQARKYLGYFCDIQIIEVTEKQIKLELEK